VKRWIVSAAVLCLLSILLSAFASLARADEGMWLFNFPPTAQVRAKYGFELTPPWLDHVRLSSVRFNNGGSGSFVSADGLTMTNHHVGATCIHQLSTSGKDYMMTGFYARTRAEEAKCPDLELNVLQEIQDVTAQINAAAKPGTSVADQGQAQRAAMSAVEDACAKASGLRCDVMTLYSGAMYNLYKYKKYTDVRLVFAPEYASAFFGGDPDNFEFPRYDLDVTFFRVYENGQPAQLANYLKWSTSGVKEGDLVFVSGHPGSTGRLNTVAQLEFLRDTAYPGNLASLERRDALLKKFGAESAENARIAQEDIFGIENSLKALKGYEAGLRDQAVMDKKAADEMRMRQAIAADPQKRAEFGDPFTEIAKAMKVQQEIYLPLAYIERMAGFRGDLPGTARALVRAAEERAKPNGERLREYRDTALPALQQSLLSTAPIYKSLDTLLLTDSLADLKEKMPDSAVVKRVLGSRAPAEVAQELISGTRLDDIDVRKQLYEGGEEAVRQSSDPLIVLMRELDAESRAIRKRYDDEVDAVVRNYGGSVAKIRFANLGTNAYPDATFTLRLAYGAVRGYTETGAGTMPKGSQIPYFTTIGGAYEHAARHNNEEPYQLPESWTKAKSKVHLQTPLNIVQTSDIIGGNSGSPVINRAGEIVGIIFDGNIQSLPWNFVYDDSVGRSTHVDSRGILEAVRNIYGATSLADELQGKTKRSAK
jgi:hypothetical protein